jgi:hypothetical protein
MLIKIIAGVLLLVALFTLFRFAMSLRWARTERLQERRNAEARGRRVVAEIPLPDGALTFLLEDAEAFYWSSESVRKAKIVGARMLLNGGIIGECASKGHSLPPPIAPQEFEGRERWDVAVYLREGRIATLPCGTLREGVSREIAGRAFEAIRAAVRDAEPASDQGNPPSV